TAAPRRHLGGGGRGKVGVPMGLSSPKGPHDLVPRGPPWPCCPQRVPMALFPSVPMALLSPECPHSLVPKGPPWACCSQSVPMVPMALSSPKCPHGLVPRGPPWPCCPQRVPMAFSHEVPMGLLSPEVPMSPPPFLGVTPAISVTSPGPQGSAPGPHGPDRSWGVPGDRTGLGTEPRIPPGSLLSPMGAPGSQLLPAPGSSPHCSSASPGPSSWCLRPPSAWLGWE
uniref:Uncharacterized protein n=1 Tax=Calidris pygmaea TaxID=425635 RepID=A0A8C3K0U9_9CHAR